MCKIIDHLSNGTQTEFAITYFAYGSSGREAVKRRRAVCAWPHGVTHSSNKHAIGYLSTRLDTHARLQALYEYCTYVYSSLHEQWRP